TGLTGAFGLEKGFFSGKFLLNIDSEDFTEITISSAGGGDTEFSIPITTRMFAGYEAINLEVSGLSGGHSGIDIHLPRSNALKVLVSGLAAVRDDVPISLGGINGGTARNAIPRDARAVILFPSSELEKAVTAIEEWKQHKLGNKQADDSDLSIEYGEANQDSGLSF
ncbi:MAG: peptidase dimerization domain-containing protein, partial [Candidatus Hodarchaeales archaeon]